MRLYKVKLFPSFNKTIISTSEVWSLFISRSLFLHREGDRKSVSLIFSGRLFQKVVALTEKVEGHV